MTICAIVSLVKAIDEILRVIFSRAMKAYVYKNKVSRHYYNQQQNLSTTLQIEAFKTVVLKMGQLTLTQLYTSKSIMTLVTTI